MTHPHVNNRTKGTYLKVPESQRNLLLTSLISMNGTLSQPPTKKSNDKIHLPCMFPIPRQAQRRKLLDKPPQWITGQYRISYLQPKKAEDTCGPKLLRTFPSRRSSTNVTLRILVKKK